METEFQIARLEYIRAKRLARRRELARLHRARKVHDNPVTTGTSDDATVLFRTLRGVWRKVCIRRF